jgi:hypothetical protein
MAEFKSDLEKIKYLIAHWVEHTEEHAEEFERWAERISGMEGGEEISLALRKAAQKLKEVVELLKPYKE